MKDFQNVDFQFYLMGSFGCDSVKILEESNV